MTTTDAAPDTTRGPATSAPFWLVLTAVLGGALGLIGLTSPLPLVTWPAIVGGLLVVTAPLLSTRSRWLGYAVLAVGAALPVAAAWWSLVVPVTAALALVCGSLAIRATRPRTRSAAVGRLNSSHAAAPGTSIVAGTRGGVRGR